MPSRNPETINTRIIETFGQEMADQIKNLDEHLIPLAKVYLDALRGVRMGIGAEVRDILQTSRQIQELTKDENVKAITDFSRQCQVLHEILRDEKFVEKLKRLL